MPKPPFSIHVPASTANLGPGFDSIGIALDRYLSVHAFRSEVWETEFLGNLKSLQENDSNLIIHAAQVVADSFHKKLPACRLQVESSIPLSKGMGSSASAIVAGIELANLLLDLHLSKEEKGLLASNIEGHPDNVVPSLYGGLVISCYDGSSLDTVHVPDVAIEMVVAIPEKRLHTKQSRASLPSLLPFNKAVEGSAISNVLVASILKNDWEKAASMMEKDIFHEPFRSKWVPHYSELKTSAVSLGAYGAAISGSGPSIVCFAPHHKGFWIAEQLSLLFPDMQFEAVFPDRLGVVIEECPVVL
jgi:homoserine kinase